MKYNCDIFYDTFSKLNHISGFRQIFEKKTFRRSFSNYGKIRKLSKIGKISTKQIRTREHINIYWMADVKFDNAAKLSSKSSTTTCNKFYSLDYVISIRLLTLKFLKLKRAWYNSHQKLNACYNELNC